MAVKQLPKISPIPEPPNRLVGDQERFDTMTFNSLKAQEKMVNEDLNKTLIPALNEFAVDVNASVDAAALSERNAHDSEEVAKRKAGEASGSAGAAKVSEDNAKVSETNALASKNAAALSAESAESDRIAAEAARDEAKDIANVGYASTTHSGLSRVDGETIQAGELGKLSIVQAVMELIRGAVQKTRKVIAGAGLTGGGALSGDVTLNVSQAVFGNLVKPGSVIPFYSVNLGGPDNRNPIFWGESEPDTGWLICDGGSDGQGGSVPDLRGKFIMCSSYSGDAGQTGGAASVTPTVSVQNATQGGSIGNTTAGGGIAASGTGVSVQGTTLDGNTLPSHNHSMISCIGASNQGVQNFLRSESTSAAWVSATNYTGNSWAHAHGIYDPGHSHGFSGTAHSHTFTGAAHTHAATANAISTVPPYYKMAYCVKLPE